MFPITKSLKHGDAFLPLLFNFALEYAIRRVQANQDGLKLNGSYQILVYADYVNILVGSVHTVKKNTEALLVASEEVCREVNADKSKCRVRSRYQNARQDHNTRTKNKSFESVDSSKMWYQP
jgi:hypothetical protein